MPAWRAFADIDRLRGLAAATRPTWNAVDVLALPAVPTTVTHAAVAADPVGINRLIAPAFGDGVVAALAHDLWAATVAGPVTAAESHRSRCAE